MWDWAHKKAKPEKGRKRQQRRAPIEAYNDEKEEGLVDWLNAALLNPRNSGAESAQGEKSSLVVPSTHKISEQDINAFRWAFMFDLDRKPHAIKAGQIASLEMFGEGNFIVYKKSSDTRGRSGLIEITQLSFFPLWQDLVETTRGVWGGGDYVVRHSDLPSKNLFEYNVDGPPLMNGRPMASDLPGAPIEAKSNTPEALNDALKGSLIKTFFENLTEGERQAFGRKLASQEFGIKLDEPQKSEKPPTAEEEMLEEYFQDHPDEKDAYVKEVLLKPKL